MDGWSWTRHRDALSEDVPPFEEPMALYPPGMIGASGFLAQRSSGEFESSQAVSSSPVTRSKAMARSLGDSAVAGIGEVTEGIPSGLSVCKEVV